jgi:hypothetical protein
MIKINDNYYARDTIKKVTPITRKEENCVYYFIFSVYISLGDSVITEHVISVDNDNSDSLSNINYLFDELLKNITK